MRLSFLSLCLTSFILLTSCTKESVPQPSGNNSNDYVSTINVITSNWVSASSMTWTNNAANADTYLHSEWVAPELSQEILDNEAVLVYIKAANDDEPKLLPAQFLSTDNTEYDVYGSNAEPHKLQLFHTKYKDGISVTPSSVNDNVIFRYILIDNIRNANASVTTDTGEEYSMEELKAMSYTEVTAILGITEQF